MNFLEGVSSGDSIKLTDLDGQFTLPVTLPPAGTKVAMGIRPEHIEIDPNGDSHVVELTEALGGVSYAHLKSDMGEKIVVEERGDIRSQEGVRVGLNFPLNRAMLFDRKTELRIR